MSEEKALPLAKLDSNLAVGRPQPTVAEILAAAVQGGVSSENVAVVEKLTELMWKSDARDAEKQFAAAFKDLQAEMPKVRATKAIPNRDRTIRSTFAPYEEIMDQVRPMLEKHGFTVTFSTDYREGRVFKTCILQHMGGHKQTNTFGARIGSGPPAASEAQADGAAATFAKRGALCDALNIVIEHDTDARAQGANVTAEQADELEKRCAMLNVDRPKFLRLAGDAENFSEIPAVMYNILDEFLAKKERTGK